MTHYKMAKKPGCFLVIFLYHKIYIQKFLNFTSTFLNTLTISCCILNRDYTKESQNNIFHYFLQNYIYVITLNNNSSSNNNNNN